MVLICPGCAYNVKYLIKAYCENSVNDIIMIERCIHCVLKSDTTSISTPKNSGELPTCHLGEMYMLQKKLHERIIKDNPVYPRLKQDRIMSIMTAIMHECMEVQQLMQFKWWKKSNWIPPVDTDDLKLKEELIDILHFWLDACIECNFNLDEIYNTFKLKNDINHKRLDDQNISK